MIAINCIFMRCLRNFLLPFALIYGLITWIRNKFFDWRFFSTYQIPVKSILVGNLSVGGTGKTPHVTFLVDFISQNFSTTILSRGYGRKTKGYLEANSHATALTIGDEPLSYYKRFHDKVSVVVCESRTEGVKRILQSKKTDVIVLDDAFQHRNVQVGFSILLMDYTKPFYRDFMLPTGDLREFSCGKKRADRLIVTKCPKVLTEIEKNEIIIRSGFPASHVFFSNIVYGEAISFSSESVKINRNVLLVTGISNPTSLFEYLIDFVNNVEMMTFPDHHMFTLSDIQKIHTKFEELEDSSAVILTTEKDFMRLQAILMKEEIGKYPWCYVPISILIDREKDFIEEIISYVDTI